MGILNKYIIIETKTKNMTPKRKKDLLMTAGAVLAVFIAVMGWHFSETSNRPFWSNFWIVAAVLCLLACVGGWIYLNNKYKAPKR